LPFVRVVRKCLIPKPYDVEPKTIGEHLKRRRLELGVYQKDVAKQIGVTLFSIMNWETGLSRPMTRHLPAIFKFLGYNPMPDAPSTVPALLKAQRLELGLSQEQAAKQLCVDETTWARWERGKRIGKPEHRKRVMHFIGLSEDAAATLAGLALRDGRIGGTA
jgi:transcriptional regulator with XRE-family HTH domain